MQAFVLFQLRNYLGGLRACPFFFAELGVVDFGVPMFLPVGLISPTSLFPFTKLDNIP